MNATNEKLFTMDEPLRLSWLLDALYFKSLTNSPVVWKERRYEPRIDEKGERVVVVCCTRRNNVLFDLFF